MASLMELLERFVIAHEKQAEASMIMAQNASNPVSVGFIDYGQSDGTECTAGQTPVPAPTPPTTEDWNPYNSPIQKQYKGEKAQILDAELAKLGLQPGEKMTGAQKHQLLLNSASHATVLEEVSPTAPAAPVAPAAPAAPTAPAAPAAPTAPVAPVETITLDSIRAIFEPLAAKGPKAQAEILRLMKEIGGVTRLTDPQDPSKQLLPEDKVVPLYQALLAALNNPNLEG